MPAPSDLEAWDFLLPEEAIARHPTALRDGSRLMQLPLGGGPCVHHNFATLPDLLRPDDLLVVNDTRVMRARLTARRPTGGRAELLVLEFNDRTIKALAKPSKKLRIGQRLELSDGSGARVLTAAVEGVLSLELDAPAYEVMDRAGQLPIPPYLKRQEAPSDRDRYQTVYAGPLGSSAAPTAGLHFTPELLASLATRGVRRAHVTLHVGLGTFRPVRPEDLERGSLHAERYVVSEACVA
ncbi:MAG: S-adenosylmethionine:tRNA ribosyltransferase-isomerase, partial [Myxococcota bacterium]